MQELRFEKLFTLVYVDLRQGQINLSSHSAFTFTFTFTFRLFIS